MTHRRAFDVPASYDIVQAVMLCLDSAKGVTGSALIYPDATAPAKVALAHRCEVRTQPDREAAVEHLYTLALSMSLPPVIYAETWTPGGNWGFQTILGIGEGWGMWTAEFERARHRFGARSAPAPVFRAPPNVWRDALFGKKRPTGREDSKMLARVYVERLMGVRVTDDVAEAICIGLFGIRDADVLAEADRWRLRQAKVLRDAMKAAG